MKLLKLTTAALAAFFMSTAVLAHHPAVTPPPPPTPAPAPAPVAAPAAPAPVVSAPWCQAACKTVKLGIVFIVAYVGYCLITEDPDYCKREEDEHAWPNQ